MKKSNVIYLCFLTGLIGCDLVNSRDAALPIISAATEWQPYTSDDGTLSASFPQAPKLQRVKMPSPIGELKMPVASFEGRDMAFTLSKVTYPVDPSRYSVGLGLKGAIAGAEVMSKGTIESQKDIFMYGMPGKEVVIKVSFGKASRMRIFIDAMGPTLYEAQVVGNLSDLDGQAAEKFFNSVNIQTSVPSPLMVEFQK